MISIILKFDGLEKRFCFTKRSISIGPKNAADVDIPIPIENMTHPYALIEEHNGRYTIQNNANDPLLKYNDLPFGRRTLAKGSRITIQNIELIVDSLDEVVEDRIPKETRKEEEADNELALLMQEVESLEIKETPTEEKPAAPSLKKYYWASTFSILAILLLTTFFATLYFSSHVKSEEEELKAARGVADTAIALFYAKLHSIRPTNNNWSDPKFLHQILSEVIPKTTTSYSNIDPQGNFRDFPYHLRIYTNDDASRFLLLAQPQSNLMSWFNTKDSIVIESTNMELRKLPDIQPLNRILFNAKELNENTMMRIATIVKEGALIPLHKLDHSDPVSQFSPPGELQMVLPGAQHLVYNSPRYHKLTQPILAEALDDNVSSELLDNLNHLMQIPSLVFYTTEGIKSAVRSYKNLNPYITSQKLLVGYFSYSPKTLLPTKTELLVMNQPAEHGVEKEKKKTEQTPAAPITIRSELYQNLIRLNARRKEALEPYTKKIHQIIYENNGMPTKGFKKELIVALKEYENEDLIQQRKISASLRKLYKKKIVDQKEMTPQQFFSYIKATGLTAYVKKQSKEKKAARKYNPLIQAKGRVKSSSKAAVLD